MNKNLIQIKNQTDAPLDTIQHIQWDIYDTRYKSFFTAGWDGYVRLYEIEGSPKQQVLTKKWEFFFRHPVITMDNNSQKFVFAGLANGQISYVKINSKNSMILGSHEAGICKVIWIEESQTLLSFGYDCVIKAFSLKNNNSNGNYQINEYKLPAKTITVSYNHPYVLIGSQCGQIALINIKEMNKINFKNEYNSLFSQKDGLIKFSCSSLLPSMKRTVFGTCDGRIIKLQYTEGKEGISFNTPIVQRFQRQEEFMREFSTQINSIQTGVKDKKHQFFIYYGNAEFGVYNFSAQTKSKVYDVSRQINTIALSPDLEYYAIGTGNDWTKGLVQLQYGHKFPQIFISKFLTEDCIVAKKQ